MQRTEVLIVGAGQAGLALSACLSRQGVEHVLLERGRTAERWRSERWPSLRLLTPTWMNRLPHQVGDIGDPDGFMDRAAVVGMLEAYARAQDAPVVEGARVRSLTAGAMGFFAVTDASDWAARAAAIATGACDRPALPGWARALDPSLVQVTPAAFRSAGDLPSGGVLVVGASATGAQLAREIHASGRPVTLAAGRHTRLPRRYRGRDIMHWLDRVGILDEPPAHLRDLEAARRQPSLQLSGRPEEADLSLARLAAEGVRIVRRAEGGAGARVALGTRLAADCAASELRRRHALARIDAFIARTAPDTPGDPAAWAPPRHPISEARSLDLAVSGIRTVLWATGFRRDYGWLRLPALDGRGEIAHQGGVTAVPGLYALGLPMLRRRGSTFIGGAGRDAEALAPLIAADLGAAALAA